MLAKWTPIRRSESQPSLHRWLPASWLGTLDNLRHLRTMRRLIGIEYQGVVDDHRVAAVVLRPVHSTVGASEEGIEFSSLR